MIGGVENATDPEDDVLERVSSEGEGDRVDAGREFNMTFSTDTTAEGKCLSECERGVASFESLAWKANETTPISFGDKANAGVGVAALVPRPTLKHPTDTASSPRPFPLPLPLPRPRPLPLPLLSLIGSDDPAVRSSGLVWDTSTSSPMATFLLNVKFSRVRSAILLCSRYLCSSGKVLIRLPQGAT